MPPPPTVALATVPFACPSCLRHLRLPAELAGQLTRCPACRSLVNVPGASAEAAAAAAAAAAADAPTTPLRKGGGPSRPRPPVPSFVRFVCPACQAGETAAPQYAGLSGPCPACGATISVPALPPPPSTVAGATLLTARPLNPPSSGPSVAGVG